MPNQITSNGTWSIVNSPSARWTQGTSTLLTIRYVNDTNYDVNVNSFTITLGVGSGTLYGSTSGSTPYYSISNSGIPFDVTATTNNISFTGTASGVVNVQYVGTTQNSGYFYEVNDNNDTYRVTLSSTTPLRVNSGETVDFNIHKVASSNTAASVYGSELHSADTSLVQIPGSFTSVRVLTSSSSTLYGEVTVLRSQYTFSEDTPSGTTVTESYSIVSTSEDNPSTIESNVVTVNSQTTVQVILTATCPGYDGEFTGTATANVLCRLHPPIVLIDYPESGGFTVGSTITTENLQVSPGTAYPNSIDFTYSYNYSTDSGSNSSSGTSVILNNSTTCWRALVSATGYVPSDYSSWTSNINTYYEPRDMSSHGFEVAFTYQAPGGISGVVIPSTVTPTGLILVSWNEFLVSQNLGRFNYWQLDVVDSTTSEVLASTEGTNTPDSGLADPVSISIPNTIAGQSCYVRLNCKCKYPLTENGTMYGPQDSAVFSSSTFLVGNRPGIPTLLHPSSSLLYTANLQPRIIFQTVSPGALSENGVTNIEVNFITTTTSTIFSYQNNPDYFCSTLTAKPSEFYDGDIVDFTVPTSVGNIDAATFRIRCSSPYLTGEWSNIYAISYDNLSYMETPRELQASDLSYLLDACLEVINCYDSQRYQQGIDYNSIFHYDGTSPYVRRSLFVGNSNTILPTLIGFYNRVSIDSVPPTDDQLDLSLINTTDVESIVSAVLPSTTVDTKFPVSDNYFSPIGNYFNYIIYILKYLL